MFFRFAGLCMVSVSYTLFFFSSGFGLCLSLYRQSFNVLCSLSILLQVQCSTKELLRGTGHAKALSAGGFVLHRLTWLRIFS